MKILLLACISPLPTRASSTAQPLQAQWELIRSAENHQAISLARDASFYQN